VHGLRIQNPPLTIASEVLLQRPGNWPGNLVYSLLLFIWSTISDLVCTITASGSWYFKSGVIVHYRAQLFIIAIYMAINIICYTIWVKLSGTVAAYVLILKAANAY
jgi:hypothetical protein